jgi:hypothetical protein
MTYRGLFAALFALPFLTSRALAQCADGSPPPCAAATSARTQPRETVRAIPVDPNRVAILPFRVTTTDTLLGEGFAELLATEFTGEGAPRAVDMATVLSAWRRAGGGLRTPLPREKAMQVARSVGAGLVSEGSIVGLGKNITVTASLFNAASGQERGAPTKVNASADSLESALKQTASSMIAAVGGAPRAFGDTRYTSSPQAMRWYLQGLSAWRRGKIPEAAADFEKATTEDSSFAQAWFRRYFVALWTSTAGPFQRPAWERRGRLSPQERTILEGLLGTEFPKPRTIEQRLNDRARAAELLPDSPEALYLAGDYFFHYGSAIDPANSLARSRDYMAKSAAIDSATTTLRHLIEVGVRLRDTSLLRSVLPAYLRTEDAGRLPGAMLAAASVGDAATVAAVRRREFPPDEGESFWVGGAALMAEVPVATIEEVFSRWLAVAPPPRRMSLQGLQGFIAFSRGRPAAAQRIWGRPGESGGAALRDAAMAQLAMDLGGGSLGTDFSEYAKLLRSPRMDTAVTDDACLLAVWRFRHGDTVGLNLGRFVAPVASPACRVWVDVATIPRDRSPATLTRLAAADSAVRNRMSVATNLGIRGFEPFILADAWEANGDVNRALTAIRYRIIGLGPAEGPWTLPVEGRLAAQVGDTTGAVRAYRMWLGITADAEPVLKPKRDSVLAELTRLTRRTVP